MNKKIIMILMLCISLVSLNNVNAQEIIVDDELVIDNIRTVTKYVKIESLIDRFTNEVLEVKETELSKEQYDRLDYMSETQASCTDGAACWETEYKKISLSISSPSSVLLPGTITVKTTWKKTPAVKSYDIIAASFARSMSSVSVSLSSDVATSAGKKELDSGAGISVKLNSSVPANSTITMTIKGKFSQLDYWLNSKICATYQHAQSSVSSADSLAYAFSRTSGGIGGVLEFNSTTIKDKYDQMQGVCVG